MNDLGFESTLLDKMYFVYRKIRRYIMNGPNHEYPTMRRHKISRSKSRKNFSRNSGVHPKNNRPVTTRGGYRL